MSVAAIAAPVHPRLRPGWSEALPAPGPLDLGDGFVALVSRLGTPWLPNAIVLGPGPPVVWDPFLAPLDPGPALATRGAAVLRALGVAETADGLAGDREAPSALSPARAVVAALLAALRSGDPAARLRAAHDLVGRGPGLTPEGDDLLAGAAAVAAAAGDPLVLPPRLRELTTPLSATLLELAAAGAAPRPVHALLDLDDAEWRTALRALERLGASSGRAIALGVGGAAAALGARRPAARCATLLV
ncbi:MAG TPA: DUF2877 domain-containing protein [Solirubrobacteraceae bacterium]